MIFHTHTHTHTHTDTVGRKLAAEAFMSQSVGIIKFPRTELRNSLHFQSILSSPIQTLLFYLTQCFQEGAV